MGWNGSGQFNRDNGVNSGSDVWTQDKGDGTKILASLHDAHDEDIVTGLENCLTRDGQNSPSADLPMATYKHTGVGDATAKTHYASAGQVLESKLIWAGTSGGSSNAYTLTLPVAPTYPYATGSYYRFIANHNSTGACTLNINGLGAEDLKDYYGAMSTGSIKTGDHVVVFHNGTDFIRMPVNGPRLQSFSPTLVGSGSMTLTSQVISRAIIGRDEEGVSINVGMTFTVGGTPSDTITFTTPYATSSVPTALSCAVWGGSGYHTCVATVASSTVEVRKLDGNFSAGTLRAIYINGKYPDS